MQLKEASYEFHTSIASDTTSCCCNLNVDGDIALRNRRILKTIKAAIMQIAIVNITAPIIPC
jgi:hypothetical protein